MTGVSMVFMYQARPSKVTKSNVVVLGTEMTIIGARYVSALMSMSNLAESLSKQGNYEQAMELQIRVFTTYVDVLGPRNPETLIALCQLQRFVALQTKIGEAEEFVRLLFEQVNLTMCYTPEQSRVQNLRMHSLENDSTSTFDMVNNLGSKYHDQGELAKAKEIYVRALAGKEKLLGSDHSSTLDTINSLGKLYCEQEELVEAEEMYKRVLATSVDSSINTQRHIAACGLAMVLSRSIRSQPVDSVDIKNCMYRLVRHVKEWYKSDMLITYWLAKAFLWLEDDENATIAYVHTLSFVNGTSLDLRDITCDGCRRVVVLTKGCYVCLQCDDIDLCGVCMSNCKDNDLALSTCHGHKYCDIGAAVSQALKSADLQGEKRMDIWLNELHEKYQEEAVCRTM